MLIGALVGSVMAAALGATVFAPQPSLAAGYVVFDPRQGVAFSVPLSLGKR